MKETKKMCPLIGQECMGHECEFLIKVVGHNPQTGEPVDAWKCTFQWLPLLLVENSMMSRQTGAAVESFRNEMVRQNDQMLLLTAADQKLIEGK